MLAPTDGDDEPVFFCEDTRVMQNSRNATMVDRSTRSVDHPAICAVLRCQIYRPLLGHPVSAVNARKEDVFLPLGPVSA
jgi:hypothetical protein